jgi:RNA polymerase sigma factor (sigma-70 family)
MSVFSNDEVIKIFKQIDLLKNDQSKSTEINKLRDEIVKSLSFLVYENTKSYRKFPNYEDLVQEGFIGLIKAVKKFDYNKYPNFFMYANQWIKNGVKRSASRFDIVYNPERKRVVYAEIEKEEIDPINVEDIFLNKERQIKLKEIINEFSDRDKEIIKRLFGIDKNQQTLREIGKELDLTHERIRQIKNGLVNKLRDNKKLEELSN